MTKNIKYPLRLSAIAIWALISILFLKTNAYCNGATAGHASTGLFFVNEENISIEYEILKIDNLTTEVNYFYENHSGEDITSTIAFPIAPPYHETFQALTYDNFDIWVDGEHREFDVEYRILLYAYIKERKDCTDLFNRLGLPLLYESKEELMRHLANLKREELLILENEGLISHSSVVPGYIGLHWQVVTKFYWTQTFPANDTVKVRIKYKSIPGHMDVETGTEGRPSAIVNYILTTANYWHGPIKNFTLMVTSKKLGENVTIGVKGIDERYLLSNEDGELIYRIENFTPDKNLSILYEYD